VERTPARAGIALGLLLTLVAACGSRAPSSGSSDGIPAAPPATTLVPAPTVDPPPTITSAGALVACPAPSDDPAGDVPDVAAMDIGTIEPDIGVVQAYGAAHPEEFVGFRTVHTPPPSRIEAAFTAHVAEHADALAALVAHPERLDVVERHHTQTQLNAILATIQQRQLPHVIGVGMGWAAVSIEFAPGEEAAAESLLAEWGDALTIRIGGQTYVPDECGPQPAPRTCADLAGSDPAEGGLRLTVVPDSSTIAVSDTGTAKLVVENIGSERFAIDSGIPIVGVLVEPGTSHVVGEFVGGIAGVGGGVDLAPGEQGTIGVIFGAARCDGQPGSALPPGTYGLRVVLTAEGPANASGPAFVSPEAPITVSG